MRTIEQVEQEIAQTKAELSDVHGTETEVYARIVGYYRAVKHWNNGKKDEFNIRKMFVWDSTSAADEKNAPKEVKSHKSETTHFNETTSNENAHSTIASYEIYTKKTCPNCPPVKDFMSKVELNENAIDVDTEEGLAQAAKKGVFASPTVIFYDAQGTETARCHNVEELEVVFNKVTVTA